MRRLAALVLLAACGERGGAPAPDAQARLPRQVLVDIAADAECRRLEAGDGPDALDAHLEAALRARGATRAQLDGSPGDAELLRLVEEKVAACRRAAGFSPRPYDGGLLWEK